MMNEFLNTYASSIFALLMLIVSLLIPTISERVKITYQLKVDNTKRDKSTYEYLINCLYEFYNASRTLYSFIIFESKIQNEIVYEEKLYSHAVFKKKFIDSNFDIVLSLYIKSLNLDKSVLLKINPCLTTMQNMITLFNDFTLEDDEFRKSFGPLISIYQLEMIKIRFAIKKIVQ